MSPELQKLRSERDLIAAILVATVRDYTKHAAALARLQNMASDHQTISIDFRETQRIEKNSMDKIRQVSYGFREAQARWAIAFHDKSTNAKAELTQKLKGLVFDWSKIWYLGDQIDAASIRWGAFGVAAQGGEETPISEQICGIVSSGATPKRLIEMRHAISHMPNYLGSSDYRHCCLLAIGLELRMKGVVSSMEEINEMLHWYDRAEALMVDTKKISAQFFLRMGLQ